MFELVSNFFGAVKNLFGFAQQRDAEKNAPEIKANAAAQTRERVAEGVVDDVVNGDIDRIRKDAGEN